MKVRFNICEEWLDELRNDPPMQGYIRLTRMYVPLPISPYINRVAVIASYVNKSGEVIELCQQTGEDWGHNDAQSNATRERTQELMDKIGSHVERAGLQIRAGYFTDED